MARNIIYPIVATNAEDRPIKKYFWGGYNLNSVANLRYAWGQIKWCTMKGALMQMC